MLCIQHISTKLYKLFKNIIQLGLILYNNTAWICMKEKTTNQLEDLRKHAHTQAHDINNLNTCYL